MKDGEERIFKQIDAVASEMENLFYHLFAPRNPAKCVGRHTWSPLSDVYETADELIVKMELAGVKRDNIGITLDGGRLTIRGLRQEAAPPETVAYHQMEINYGYFERVFHLRPGVAQEDISAHFEDGFLTIAVAKRPPSPERSTEIEVE